MIQQTQIDARFMKIQQTFLKDEHFTKTEHQTSANLWKMNAEDTRITTELAR